MSQLPYATVGGYQPYWPPPRPGAVVAFYVYCALMALLYLVVVILGAIILLSAAEIAAEDPDVTEAQARLIGGTFLGLGLIFLLAYLVLPFLPRATWAWIVGIIAIAFGLTSCCLWPLCIPLLIFYLKEPTQRWYGKEPTLPAPAAYMPMGAPPYPPPHAPQYPPPHEPRWGGGA